MTTRGLPFLMLPAALLLGGVLGASAGRAQAEGAPVLDEEASEGDEDDVFTDFIEGKWLDPDGEFWVPRRGNRTELGFFIGGEAGLGEAVPNEALFPTVGGLNLSPVVRYYPVDNVAIAMGTKLYTGIDAPAAGTAAATVFTPFFGVRYDLVREKRFSVLTDVMSGPTFFVFADVTEALRDGQAPLDAAWALGAEALVALSLRYSLGPFTLEGRLLVGGRGGSAREIQRPTGDVGPFSALYAGVDTGATWSFWADGSTHTAADASASP